MVLRNLSPVLNMPERVHSSVQLQGGGVAQPLDGPAQPLTRLKHVTQVNLRSTTPCVRDGVLRRQLAHRLLTLNVTKIFIIYAQGSAPNGMSAGEPKARTPRSAPGRGPSILPVLIWSSFLKRAPQADWRLFMACEYTSIYMYICIHIYIYLGTMVTVKTLRLFLAACAA